MMVFPMAGLSRRFAEAGYDRPKYMLEAGGRSLFWHSVYGFKTLFDRTPFLFIYRDIDGTADFIRREVAAMGITTAHFAELRHPTEGQADTVARGLDLAAVPDDTPLTIFNIDTVRPGYAPPRLPRCDGWLEVFRGDGANWSFVRPEREGSTSVTEVTEKDPISDLCCTGLYSFRSAGQFRAAFAAECAEGPSQAGEFYVAPLYNRLLAQGAEIHYALIPREAVTFSGVPQEYEAFKSALA